MDIKRGDHMTKLYVLYENQKCSDCLLEFPVYVLYHVIDDKIICDECYLKRKGEVKK